MIEIRNLGMAYSGFSLADINLSIGQGEFFMLMGPTGSGKTLTLEAMAGLAPVHQGRILVNGKDITFLPPEKRGVGLVYQDYALFPHLTVLENIMFGARYQRRDQSACRKRTKELMARLGISNLAHRLVTHLSGGEKQRVALVRALSVAPDVLLLDEPLSALDPAFRDEVQQLLKILHQDTNTTFVMVTHDFAEALFLGERGAILNNGRIAQQGRLAHMFRSPAKPFVARFMGMKNLFDAVFDRNRAFLDGFELMLDNPAAPECSHILVHAEDIRLQAGTGSEDAPNQLTGKLEAIIDRRAYCEVRVRVKGYVFCVTCVCAEARRCRENPSDTLRITIPPAAIVAL